jgi:hypothetical protein
MCNPAALVALTIAQGVTQYMGQAQAAKAQQSANNASAALITQNQKLQIQSLQNREEEDAAKAGQQAFESQRAARERAATARVSAGEAGVSGLSIDALMGDYSRQSGENTINILTNLDYAQRQRQLERESIGITSKSQINQLPQVQSPSLLGSALETGANAAFTYYKTKPQDTSTLSDGTVIYWD